MKRRDAPSEGSFFRRHTGQYYRVDDPVATRFMLYWTRYEHGRRFSICMHTTSLQIARRRAARFPKGEDLSSEERFLKALSRAGQLAQERLDETYS